MEKKIGSIVFATDQGLGYLAKSFYDHGIINQVYIQPHGSRTNHWDWYPRESVVPTPELLLESCDTLLFFEEVWHWKLIPQAREKGVRTVLMPMYECTRNPLPYQPDAIINPSLLDQDYFPQGTFIPVPVDVPWRLRERARIFVHNAGNGGLGGRNGTKEVIEAMALVKSPIRLIIRSQVPLHWVTDFDSRIEVRIGQFDDIWSEGDVFLFPEKFNGLSLPMQEAFAAGMLVMGGDRHPINTWLPHEPLIPIEDYLNVTISRPIKSALYTPAAIAAKIDEYYDTDISKFSLLGKEYAENNSWKKLKETYQTVLLPS